MVWCLVGLFELHLVLVHVPWFYWLTDVNDLARKAFQPVEQQSLEEEDGGLLAQKLCRGGAKGGGPKHP